MKLVEVTSHKQIILVCGNLCSGKGHYCQEHFPNYEKISVSDIVRSLTKFKTRSELTTTKDLDQQIMTRLLEIIQPLDKVVVDGIRQISILNGLKEHFGNEIKDIIWLDVPENVRKERFNKRASTKDDQDFENASQGDQNLGIGDVENYIRTNHRTIKNY